jgi:hypothetical protein
MTNKIFFNEFQVKHIENFIDEDKGRKIYNELENLEYGLVSQERHGHYSHVFKSEDPKLPNENEIYAAQFYLAKNREGSKLFNAFFEKNIVPYIKKEFPKMRYFLSPNIVKITSDCYFRSHTDAYAGQVGYTCFFSSGWKWDYGGILTFVNKNGAHPIFPENNSFLLRNEEARPQHFVSPVSAWSKNKYYYLLVGWASIEDAGDSDVRGGYYDFK